MKYKCIECGQEYNSEFSACPKCGCPTEYQTVQVEQAPQETERSNDNEHQEKDGIKLVVPQIANSSITTMEIRRCPACNAPLSTSYEDTETICSYCGQKIFFVTEEDDDDEEWIDEEEAPFVLIPQGTEKDFQTAVIKKMVTTDYVPVDIFDNMIFGSSRRSLFPVYVFEVNWSANWQACFSYLDTQRKAAYDSQGKYIGMTIEQERKVHYANGTAAGDATIVRPGSKEKFKNKSTICAKYTDLLSKNPGALSHQAKELSETNTGLLSGWEQISFNLDEDEAWSNGGENRLATFVESGVNRSIQNMANGSEIDNAEYTYQPYRNSESKLLIPVWETDFSYEGKSYTASVDAWQHMVLMDDYPTEESEQVHKNELMKLFKKYRRRRTWGSILFAVLYSGFFGSIGAISVDTLYFILVTLLGIAALLTWDFQRKMHRKKLDIENISYNKYWVEKKKRQEAAKKKFGIQVPIGAEPKIIKMSCVADIIIMIIAVVGMVVATYVLEWWSH
jgi:DNA-directed RNA polymerase subunit RPC12/RpoP